MAVYRCKRCSYLYKETVQEKIFEDINPEEFKCPKCRCSKAMFEKIKDS